MGRKTREDWELWEKVKRTVKPRQSQKSESDFAALFDKVDDGHPKVAAKPKRLVRPYSPEPEIRINLLSSPVELDESIGRKISKGKISIDGRLDLHGLTQQEAYSRLHQFIDTSFSLGKRTVLVITGKGKLGEGILRQAVPRWLAEPGFADKVIGCRQAHINQGGGGALYVRLRNKNRKSNS